MFATPLAGPRRAVGIALVLAAGLTACKATPTDSGPAGTPAPAQPTAPGTSGAANPAGTTTAEPLAAAAVEATQRAAALLPPFVRAFGVDGIEPGQLALPFDVAVDARGNAYVSDSKSVQVFSPTGTFVRRIGGDELKTAQGLAVKDDGTLYVTGFGSPVRVYAPDGTAVGSIGQAGTGRGQLAKPIDVALDKDGNIYVVDAGNVHVEKYSPQGKHLLTIGEKGEANGQFRAPRNVAVDSQGRIYVSSGDDFLIQRFTPDGKYLDSFGRSYADEHMWQLAGLALDEHDNIYASQSISEAIQSFETGAPAKLRWEMGEAGQGNGQFRSPYGLAVRDGLLYVADRDNNRVQVFKIAQ